MEKSKTAIPIELIGEISSIEKIITNVKNDSRHADCLENMVKNFKRRWYRISFNHFYERVIREIVDERYNTFMDAVKSVRNKSTGFLPIDYFDKSTIDAQQAKKTKWISLNNISSKFKALISQ